MKNKDLTKIRTLAGEILGLVGLLEYEPIEQARDSYIRKITDCSNEIDTIIATHWQ